MSPQASHSSHQTATTRAARRRASLRAILLATSALASVALPVSVAHAADATWLATQPADGNAGDFNSATHWDNGVPDGTATFNASDTRDIKFTAAQTSLDGITLTSGAGAYTFDTKGNSVSIDGAGFSIQSGASLTYINTNGITFFNNGSKAGQAHIINNGGIVDFGNTSTAENASITSDGENAVIFFDSGASGDKAQITLTHGGALDISGLDGGGTTVGSLAGDSSAAVFLGSKTLVVGGNDLSTVFGGVIQDGSSGGEPGGSPGSLTKEGKGSLTLSATSINTYTGTTIVNSGALIVDGSIETSSSVTVNAGGTLAGSGTVSTTTIDAGGTLAPGHSDGTFGTLTVKGDLTFMSAAATYLVQVSPATATKTVVQTVDGEHGKATLNGATVAANFGPGSYVTKQYNILTAASLSGQFNPLIKSNLSPIFTTSLSYDSNNVFLNLSAAAPGAGLTTNQGNVATTIANTFNNTGSLPGAFATLTAAGLTQISGETAVGTQQATFDAMNQFMGVMLDPHAGGCGAQEDVAMARKAPLKAEPFCARWGVWAAGFGGSQSVSGDNVLGSNKTTSSVFGSAVGADYRFSPNTVAGFALAGGGTHFSVANGGSGNSDLFQAGAYLKHTQGAAFIAAALAYGWQDVTTNRTVTVAGIDSLRANFKTNAVSGRLEGGYKVPTQAGDITPYAAAQFTTYRLPSYAEQAAFGAGTFALGYSGKDVTATRSELGLRSEKAIAYTDSTLVLRGRLAWAHDFNTDRNVQATFLALPGSAFVVNGASPAADTALTTISAEMLWRNGWSASATADAQLSDTTHSYSGKGVIRYSW